MLGKISPFILRSIEVTSYLLGTVLTAFFISQLAQGEVQRRGDISGFEVILPAPDTHLWSPGRIANYQAGIQTDTPPVLGLLEVPSIGLKVPVYSSDSELNMDRGAGIIDGMAYPHEPGNIGIAGHRDGYFRALKDVQVGDKLLLQTLAGLKQFTVDSRQIIETDNLSVLQDTHDQTVTLVTCYPFYFVGNAPQRFIVIASLDINAVKQQ